MITDKEKAPAAMVEEPSPEPRAKTHADHGHEHDARTGSQEHDFSRAQGHWILARMGKKVLRPGGLELTKQLLAAMGIGQQHDVVEFAPGLGFTAGLTLDRRPRSYTGIDMDEAVISSLQARLGGEGRRFVNAPAAATGLPGASADVVYGEAMLTMHADHRKQEIIREAHRILRPGGVYGIHEMNLQPDAMAAEQKAAIQKDLAQAIRVNARPLTVSEWRALLEAEGFEVRWTATSPMRLLELGRMVADEGWLRTLRITFNVLRFPTARVRLLAMRAAFRRHQEHIQAVAMVAVKR